MLAMQKQIVISLMDLRYVSIECPHCKTVVTLDMKGGLGDLGKKHKVFTPEKCPACPADYDTAIKENVDGFCRAYQSLLPIAERISFRGEPESSEAI